MRLGPAGNPLGGHDAAPAGPVPDPANMSTPDPFTPPTATEQPTKPKPWKRKWVQLAATGVGGIIIGSASAQSPTTTVAVDQAAIKAEAKEEARAEFTSQIDSLEKQLETIDDGISDVSSELEEATTTGDEPTASSIPGDGTFLVGSEAKPGRYKSTAGDGCYWARLKGTGGGFDDIITNGNPTGPGIITIKKTDKAFETARCGEWRKV